MRELIWDKIDFLEFFSVEPVEEEFGSFHYEVERDGLRLLFSVWECEGVVQASLFRTKTNRQLYTWAAFVRGAARVVRDKRGLFLEFEDCIVTQDHFWEVPSDEIFDRKRFPHSVMVTVEIDPDIRINFVHNQSRT